MIKIKDSIIGEGIPKICVPIVEKTQEAILDQAQEIVSESVDIVEWRLDFYDDVHDIDCVIQTADLLQSILGKTVLLLTFRTKKEGGQKDISLEEYKRLLLAVAKSGKTDMIDVEAFRGYDVSEQKETFSVDDTENEAIRVIFPKSPIAIVIKGFVPVTFGCLGKASAPGQIEVENLRKTLSLLGKEE